MNKSVFYDPQRKRWRRLRRIFDVLALAGLLLGIIFTVGVIQMKPLPELRLTGQTRNYRAFTEPPKPVLKPGLKAARNAHRKTETKPSDIPLNSGEGLRAAYYVDYDAASYSSLKQHIKQIDLLFPEWLHVIGPGGDLTAYSPGDFTPFAVVDKSGVHNVDQENKVARAIDANRVDTEVFPLVNDYDTVKQAYSDSLSDFLKSDSARANFQRQADLFLTANPGYRGLTLDFENVDAATQPGFEALVNALYQDFHAHNRRLYVIVPVSDPTFDLAALAAHCDGLVLQNYDEHQANTAPGPIASQDWFLDNLRQTLKIIPKQKIILAIGSFGYDWTLAEPNAPIPALRPSRHDHPPTRSAPSPDPKILNAQMLTTPEVWQAAFDSGAQITLDPDALNAHFAYDDDDAHLRHQVWFLDAVTVLNEMRAARQLGIETFSLWRLGSEDNSLWKMGQAHPQRSRQGSRHRRARL